jgi:hypothetical protein
MPTRQRAFILAVTLLVWCFGAAPAAHAATSLQVDFGWDGLIRPGRWNPVFVTVADSSARNVTLEFHSPYDNYHAMLIEQSMAIGPQAQTFPLYVPLWNPDVTEIAVIVRDAKTRKKLAESPSPNSTTRGGASSDPSKYFLGISGRRATLRPLTESSQGAVFEAGYLDPERLPVNPVGLDGLDVLVLNSPDLNAMSVEQQQAIADWVHAGGSLILWPSDDPLPTSSPLVDLLPCRIGSATVIDQTAEELARFGLLPRFRKLTAHDLTSAPGAERVPLLGERVVAFRGRVGFGRVLVAPIDLTGLMFNSSKDSWNLWRAVLKGMVRKLPADDAATPQRYYGVSEAALREASSVRQVGDLLGSVPGAGRFGFGYVAGVMIGMMVIVGPVDWFVLKRLGRQPWTWVTTSGWIALVTLSAVYAGHLVKSGELHFRTFQLVDQVDGSAVARADVVALYSPRTTEYDVATPAESWWEPASPGSDAFYYARGSGTEVTFHQTYRDSRPEPMTVNVWNLRFLRGSTVAKAPALLDASLSIKGSGDSARRVVGTVTNTGPTALTHLAVRTKDGICVFDQRAPGASRIEPGKTVTIDAVIDPEVRATDEIDPNDPRLRGYYPGYYGPEGNRPADPKRLWDAGGNLAVRRADRVMQWLAERDDLACVYAECESPDPVVTLVGKPAIEKHYKVVRALLPLGPAQR